MILEIDMLEFKLVRLTAYEVRGLVNDERDWRTQFYVGLSDCM